MANPYTETFSLAAGGVTIAFNVRPESVKYNYQALVVKGPLPGADQSWVQHMGTAGLEVMFSYLLWNTSSVAMTGAPATVETILAQLRTWWRSFTTISVITDHIYTINANAAMSMKITDLVVSEVSEGHPHEYTITIILQEFRAGSAF